MGQPVLTGTLIQELEDSAGASFTARMPLLAAIRMCTLWRRHSGFPQWYYQHSLCIFNVATTAMAKQYTN